ncbi:luc7-like protein 3 [Nylanderia fulva]|uniref:luc7-like protein 3 n=1 Tax=Nylanderia fulva TaxID=613905 RepID=UPI0010FB24A7|nr:luc7-like protein 3 [Nylanderia fulva]
MPARRTPKVEALVVNAIRRLQDLQGSTSQEISNYISQEYDVPKNEIARQVQIALKRGLSYGILQRSASGHYSCNRNCLEQLSLGDGTGDGVIEPCPSQPWRFGVRERKRKKLRARRRRREREREKELEKRKKRRERLRGKRRGRSRGRRRRRRTRRRRRRSRTRRGKRRSRTRRGGRGRSRTRRGGRRRRSRTRRGGRSRTRTRTRADRNEMEIEAMVSEPKRNDTSKNEVSHKSDTSISEHSGEMHFQDPPLQDSQSSNTSDDVSEIREG